MNIWSWVSDAVRDLDEVDPELARGMEHIPHLVNDDHHARVDAMLPGLVARARAAKLAWVEVFLRHWGLQSRVILRHDVRGALPEAIDLLERAHRDDAVDCPQTICVAQDVCAAYGIADGPGYVAERLQVLDETCARIDPAWSCFRCLAKERVDALLDAGDAEGALRSGEADHAAAVAAGGEWTDVQHLARPLLAMGRPDDALAALGTTDNPLGGRTGARVGALLRALAQLQRGDADKALEVAPPWDELEGTAIYYVDYGRLLRGLIAAGAVPWDMEVTQRAAAMLRTLVANGARRQAVREALGWAEAALQLPDPGTDLADVWADLAEAELAGLSAPLGDDRRLAAVRRAAAAAAPPPYGTSPADAQAAWEQALEAGTGSAVRLHATLARWPELHGARDALATHWQRRHMPEQAAALYRDAWRADPTDARALAGLAGALTDARDWDGLAAAIDVRADAPEDVHVQATWYRHIRAVGVGDHAAAIAALEDLRDRFPHRFAVQARRRLGALHRDHGDPEVALALFQALAANAASVGDDTWDVAVVASMLERWDLVRGAAEALGLDVEPGRGPIEEAWGTFRLDIPNPGPNPWVWARRTGPATARVLAIYAPDMPQLALDLWVFDPVPLDPPQEGVAQRYRGVTRLEPGGCAAFELDGVAWSDDATQRVLDRVVELGGTGYLASTEDYRITDPESGATRPGGFLVLAVPPTPHNLAQLAAAFAEVAAEVDGPVVWFALRDALGDADGAAADRETARAWKMI